MDIVIRASVAFCFIFLITRVMGRRELNTLEPFDIILLVMMGDLVQQGVTQSDMSVTGLLLAGGTVAVCTVLVSYLSFRFRRLRPVLDGEPIVLVEDGNVIEKNMHRERITVEELAASARLKEIGSLTEIKWAILETNGEISFLTRS